MVKPRFIVTLSGVAIAGVGAACGYLLPVGLQCTGAFGLQKASKADPDPIHAVAALTTCKINALQFAPLWTAVIIAGIAIFVIGLIWSIVTGLRSQATAPVKDSVPAMRSGSQTPSSGSSRPTWPLLLGPAVIGLGIFLGFAISVGPHCDGAFAQQTSAAGADIASAMNGRLSDYSSECRAAAGQQSLIYWGIVGFGAAILILGLVLRTVLGRGPNGVANSGAIAGELEHLAGLLERGVLTQDEFNQQKGKLLAQG